MIKNILKQICPKCGSISIQKKVLKTYRGEAQNKFRCNKCTHKFDEVIQVELPYKCYRGEPTKLLDLYPEGRIP